MSNRKLTGNIIHYSLAYLLLFVALNAFGGGYYGFSGAKNVPAKWLKNSPFLNYFIPGLILFICVGGLAFVAASAIAGSLIIFLTSLLPEHEY